MAKAKKPAAEPAETPGQPYHLQRAQVKDYRSVRDAEVEFKPGLNIVIGPNGAGKTNFLRAIVDGIDPLNENKLVNAILYVLKNGSGWRAVPRDLPPYATVYYYFAKWSADGTWERVSGCLTVDARESAQKKPVPRPGRSTRKA